MKVCVMAHAGTVSWPLDCPTIGSGSRRASGKGETNAANAAVICNCVLFFRLPVVLVRFVLLK